MIEPPHAGTAVLPLSAVVVDDSPSMRAVVSAILELDGRVEVLAEAPDGLEAIRLAERHAPDCIVLDLDMPVLGGLQALPEIKRRAPASKVVVFSGFDGGETVAAVFAAGADACLEKRTGLPDLLPTILDVCSVLQADRACAA